MTRKNAAPGLSGISSKIWALVSIEIAMGMRTLFTEYLKEGKFPNL